MENTEAVKKESAQEEKPVVASPDSATEKVETAVEKNGDAGVQKSEGSDKKVPLSELIKHRQQNRELKNRLRELEQELSTLRPNEQVRRVAEKYGVDQETAKTLVEDIQHGANQANLSRQQESDDPLIEDFKDRASIAAMRFDDWDNYQADMQSILEEKYKKNPKLALSLDPEDYYELAKAKRSSTVSGAETASNEKIENIKNHSQASMESGKGSTTRPKVSGKWTRDKIKSLSPQEYKKAQAEITEAYKRGEIL